MGRRCRLQVNPRRSIPKALSSCWFCAPAGARIRSAPARDKSLQAAVANRWIRGGACAGPYLYATQREGRGDKNQNAVILCCCFINKPYGDIASYSDRESAFQCQACSTLGLAQLWQRIPGTMRLVTGLYHKTSGIGPGWWPLCYEDEQSTLNPKPLKPLNS